MWEELKSWIWRALRERSFRDLGPIPPQGRILIAGDSHAAGLAHNWPIHLDSSIPIINAGVAGHNTSEYCAYLKSEPLRGTSLSAAILWIGTNDARNDEHRTTAVKCVENTTEILRTLKAFTPNTFLILPPDLESGHYPFNTGSMEYLSNTVRLSLIQAAQDEKIEILPIKSISIGPDGVHGTDTEYSLFARLVLGELEKRMPS